MASTKHPNVYEILSLARQLTPEDRRWLTEILSYADEAALPERASLDEATALVLADRCSLGRAAELAGVTRWDILDRLKELGLPAPVAGAETPDEVDELAKRLLNEGLL